MAKLIFACLLFFISSSSFSAPILYTFEGYANDVYDNLGLLPSNLVAGRLSLKYELILDLQRLGYTEFSDGSVSSNPSASEIKFYTEYVSGAQLRQTGSYDVSPASFVPIDYREGFYTGLSDPVSPNFTSASFLSVAHSIRFYISDDPRNFFVGQTGFNFTEEVPNPLPAAIGTAINSTLTLTEIKPYSTVSEPGLSFLFVFASLMVALKTWVVNSLNLWKKETHIAVC